MAKAFMIVMADIPCLAFLAASMWCLHTGHENFAIWLLVICAFSFRSWSGDNKDDSVSKPHKDQVEDAK